MITLEAIFGLLAVIIMLLPSAIYLLRWLHRRYGTSRNQSDPCCDTALSQTSSSARYGQSEDTEMQTHTQSLGHYKRIVSANTCRP